MADGYTRSGRDITCVTEKQKKKKYNKKITENNDH